MSPPSPRPPFRLRPLLCLGALLLAFAGCDGRPQSLSVPDAGGCLSAVCGPPDSGPPELPEGPRVRIATFNVHRLFDTICQSGSCGGSNYEALPTPEEFAQKVDRLAQAIAALDADIVLLQEIENEDALKALLTAVQERSPGFEHYRFGELGPPASVDVAVISRYAITESRKHRSRRITTPDGVSTRFTREFLEVHVDVGGSQAVVFVAHFRSKVDDDPGRRIAEANASRDIVTASAREFPNALVVMGGDLNDFPGSQAIDAMERDGALLRVASDRPDTETWTYVYSGQRQAIDHLFLAPGGGAYVPGSFRVAREGNSYGGSDHCAPYADFALAPAP
jgi:uncharacterized protein